MKRICDEGGGVGAPADAQLDCNEGSVEKHRPAEGLIERAVTVVPMPMVRMPVVRMPVVSMPVLGGCVAVRHGG